MNTAATTTPSVTPADGALLGQFLDHRDSTGQAAFAQLVQRHAAIVTTQNGGATIQAPFESFRLQTDVQTLPTVG